MKKKYSINNFVTQHWLLFFFQEPIFHFEKMSTKEIQKILFWWINLIFQSVCRKPLSISHEALHEVRTWKFNGLLLPSSRYHHPSPRHRLVIIIVVVAISEPCVKFILIIPVTKKIMKKNVFISKKRERRRKRRISHLFTTKKIITECYRANVY